VRRWEHQEIPIDPRSWRFDEIQKATLDHVLHFHQEHIQNRPKLISIVGDKNKIDMEALAQHGKLIELTIDDLFAF